MKLKINTRILNNALKIMSNAISSNTVIPSLSFIKMVVEKEKLTFIASKVEVSIEYSINVGFEIDTPGTVLVNGKYLIEIAKKLEGEDTTFTVKNNKVAIKSGTASFTLTTIDAEEYPNISFKTKDAIGIEIATKDLKEAVNEVGFATSNKPTRPALTGVHFQIGEEFTVASATDTYRASRKKIDGVCSKEPMEFIIEKGCLNNLIATLENIQCDENYKLYFVNGSILLTNTDISIMVRTIDEGFPELKKVIGSVPKTIVAKVEAKKLFDAIDRVMFIKDESGISIVQLTFESDHLEIETSNNIIGCSNERIDDIEYTGEPLKIAFNAVYLKELLKPFKNERVVFGMSGSLKPLIATCDNKKDLIQLISPTRKY